MKDFDCLRNQRTTLLQVPKESGDWVHRSGLLQPKQWVFLFTAFSIQISWLFFLSAGFPPQNLSTLSHNCCGVVTEVVRKALTPTRITAASQVLADKFRVSRLDTTIFTFQAGERTRKRKNLALNFTFVSSPPPQGCQDPPEQHWVFSKLFPGIH